MKLKRICLTLCACMLWGCASAASIAESTPVPSETAEAVETAETTPGEEVKQEENEEPMTVNEQYPLPQSESLAFTRSLKIGWDLGNTLDAWVTDMPENELDTEIAWQPVRTTPELIHAVHQAGFETLRVPVSWHNHVQDDGTISPVFMNRVKEIVDYGMDEGMYVILNIHHDNNPEFNAVYPDQAHLEQSTSYVKNIWTQICETFRDYDEHLIFEGLNEPRLIGTGIEWVVVPGNKESDEAIQCINALNQTFVDTVRSDSGNNTTRWLLVPGYAGSPEGLASPLYQIPEDPENRVLLECHAYRPYHFALEPNGTSHYGLPDSNPKEMTDVFDTLYEHFTSKGIGAVIDEFGAVNRNNNTEDRVRFYEDYVQGAKDRGIPVCVWDNGYMTSGDEIFGMFDRKTCTVDQTLIDALMKAFR